MTNKSKLTEILRDAVSDYSAHAGEKSPVEWLQGYLGEKLPDKSLDKIHSISSEVIRTLDLMEEKKAAMNEALENGQSAENWLASDIMEEPGSNGSKARKAAEFLNGINAANCSYNDSMDIIDVIDTNQEFDDEEWNDYKLKDTLKGIAIEAGLAGMREIASDVLLKASEEGVSAVFEDSEFIKLSLEKGAVSGLKVAVSAGLAIAEESGVVPPSTFSIIAATAHETVESLTVFDDVICGRKTMTEALIEVKDTAISTFGAMWEQHGQEAIQEIQETVVCVFGAKGALVIGVVSGLLTEPQEGSKLSHIIKEIGKAALSFLTKKRELPNFNKQKTELLNEAY